MHSFQFRFPRQVRCRQPQLQLRQQGEQRQVREQDLKQQRGRHDVSVGGGDETGTVVCKAHDNIIFTCGEANRSRRAFRSVVVRRHLIICGFVAQAGACDFP